MKSVTIVIPAYNEEKRLPASIARLKTFLDKQELRFEVIIVAEKSADGTAAAAKEAAKNDKRFKIIQNKVHRGKGYAVKQGVLRAKGDYVFFMDADLSTHLSAVKRFINYFQSHPSVSLVIGSREHVKSNVVLPQNFLRRSMGRVFNVVVRMFIYQGTRDTQCGFKAFRRPAAMQLFKLQQIDGFAFDVEILFLAKKLGYKTAVLPVVWKNSADSKVAIFGGSLEMLKDLYKIYRSSGQSAKRAQARTNKNTAGILVL
jgi:dolichyl-phosphate beta-glucosyltransferase